MHILYKQLRRDAMKSRLLIKFIFAVTAAVSIFAQAPAVASAKEYTLSDRGMDIIDDYQTGPRTVQPKRDAPDLKYKEIPVSAFSVYDLSPGIDTDLDYTDWWYSDWDDCRYIFLPATADRKKLTIKFKADGVLKLNGKTVTSGSVTSILSEADEFKVTVGSIDCGTLKIMQSNLGCMYISTRHGGLDDLDAYKVSSESGTTLMLDEKGNKVYSGEYEKLTPHGNSSWGYSKKKPYNFKLPKKADLYGMGKAKKWTLLSNYLDHSMLRNTLTDEMCKTAGIDCVLDSTYIDLYADGSYRGTYQLYERVQIKKNRVNITDLEEETEKVNDKDLEDYPHKVAGASSVSEYMENSYKYYDIPKNPKDITGGYLLQFQQWNRYGGKCLSGFVTSRGQAIGIDGPEYASKAQVEYIRGFVQDFEDALYSSTGYNSKGKHYSDYIDVDSFIKAYLAEEISENIDATFSSFYFWKDSDKTGDGKLHFSPSWDHDLAYDNYPTSRINSDGKIGYSYKYDNLFAAYFPIHGYDDNSRTSSTGSHRPTIGISWLGQLYKKESYVERVAKTYIECFEPYLTAMTDGDDPQLTQLAESIKPSAEMSNARWHTYGGRSYCVFGDSSGADFMGSVDIFRTYAKNRKNWLTKLWKPYTEYIRGDVNSDGEFSISDVVTLQRWLMHKNNAPLAFRRAADLTDDDRINVFDLCLMKRELINSDR